MRLKLRREMTLEEKIEENILGISVKAALLGFWIGYLFCMGVKYSLADVR